MLDDESIERINISETNLIVFYINSKNKEILAKFNLVSLNSHWFNS